MKILYSKNNIKEKKLLKKTFKRIIKDKDQKDKIIKAITTLLESKVDFLELIINENKKIVIYSMKKQKSYYLEFNIKERTNDSIFNIIAAIELYINPSINKAIDILTFLANN